MGGGHMLHASCAHSGITTAQVHTYIHTYLHKVQFNYNTTTYTIKYEIRMYLAF